MSKREQFESWWERAHNNGNPPRFGWQHWRSGDGYLVDDDDEEFQWRWEAWQASREAIKAEQVEDSELLVAAKKLERDVAGILDRFKQGAGDGWIACADRMPEAEGRYWCYVEEQNSLGKSHYQWNCAWNGKRWWVEHEDGGRVTHWQPLPSPPTTNHPIDTTPNQYDALGKGGEQ